MKKGNDKPLPHYNITIPKGMERKENTMNMETKVYTISLDNYHGETYVEHYFQLQHALTRFLELRDEGKTKNEFESCKNSFAFFDANINEYSTYITLTESTLKNLFVDEMA